MFHSLRDICCLYNWRDKTGYSSCHTPQVHTPNKLHFVCDMCYFYRRRDRECHSRCHKHCFFYILIWIKTAILHIGNPTSFFFNAYKPFRLLNYLSLIMLYIKSTYLYVPYLFCSNYIFRIWDFGNQNQSYSV